MNFKVGDKVYRSWDVSKQVGIVVELTDDMKWPYRVKWLPSDYSIYHNKDLCRWPNGLDRVLAEL